MKKIIMKIINNKIVRKIALICVLLGVVGVLAAGGAGLIIFKSFYDKMPDITSLIEDYEPTVPTTIYDSEGNLIDTIFNEPRDLVKIDEVPDVMRDAMLAIEDKAFFSHHGIHFKRNIGAIIANYRSGRVVQGASSITQQLAKNAFLSPEKTLTRKIREAIITLEIERRYTKEEILEKYFNEVNFGGTSHGIKTAAKNYFGKDISQINLPEAAMLAGIPKAPSNYNPRTRLKATQDRANLVLREMYRDGKISQAEYEKAIAHKYIQEKDVTADTVIDENTTVILRRKSQTYEKKFPEFTNIVEQYLNDNYDVNLVYGGGLKVYTTLNSKMQDIALKTFDEYSLFKNRKDLNGGMATIDPNTGYVLSLVPGKGFKNGDFNRATQAVRQVGSSFKPFIYFYGLLNGMETNTVIEDSYFKQGDWEPRNYGGRFRGDVTLQNGLDRSINIVSIKILRQVGVDNFRNFMKQVSPNWQLPQGLALALGAFETNPLDMAVAYAIFANGGYVVEPQYVTEIQDRHGNTIYLNTPKKEKVFDSIDTSIVTSMLKSSVENGTSARAAVTDKAGKPIAQGGKTGTTNRSRSVWYVGITPSTITSLYIGRDDNESLEGLQGGSACGPLWSQFYKNMIEADVYRPSNFSYLDGHLASGELMYQNIDPVTGFITPDGSRYLMRSSGISVDTADKYYNGIAGVLGISLDGTDNASQNRFETDDSLVDDPVFKDLFN